MLIRLTARPRCPSAAAFALKGFHASTWSALPKSAGSLHAPPPGGFPSRLRRGCPARRDCYAPQSRNDPCTGNTEPLFRSLDSLHRESVNGLPVC